VVVDNNCHVGILIDVAIPADATSVKNLRKIDRHQDLCIELQRLWNLSTVKVIPIVIGCLGAYTPNLSKFLKELPGKHLMVPLFKNLQHLVLLIF